MMRSGEAYGSVPKNSRIEPKAIAEQRVQPEEDGKPPYHDDVQTRSFFRRYDANWAKGFLSLWLRAEGFHQSV
jgi:hypothetical protein